MNETSKSRRIWSAVEHRVFQGKGIDIGCGPDPVHPSARRFDIEDGDANVITQHIRDQFDYVYSSHCLEHMFDPTKALLEWWQLVAPGGYLMFLVPDEDLYEQGVFPSRFNPDHKATFTISKRKSWSPVSHNVFDLARSLPGGEIISVELQDEDYDRKLHLHGNPPPEPQAIRLVQRFYRAWRRRGGWATPSLDRLIGLPMPVDQTLRPATLAQIQCIVQKAR